MFPRGRQDTQLISAHVCLFPARIPIIHTASYPLEPVGHHRLPLTRGTCNNGATFLSVQNIIGEFTGGGSDKIRLIIGFVLFICTTIFDVVPELGDERHQCLFHFEPRVVTSKIYFHPVRGRKRPLPALYVSDDNRPRNALGIVPSIYLVFRGL